MGGVVRNLKLTLVAAIAILSCTTAVAGPFCVVISGLGRQCHYFDEASCARAATAAHGSCVVNTAEVTAPSDTPRQARFCLVSAGTGAKCNYYDLSSCARAAQDAGGSCVARH